MLVICIEGENGQGVYATGLGYKCSQAALAYDDLGGYAPMHHPSPDEEPKLKDFWNGEHLSRGKRLRWPDGGRREWYCGFEDVSQMLRWFPVEGLEKIAHMDEQTKHGIQICVYEIHGSKVKRGDHQVIFKKKEATLKSFTPISTFLLDRDENLARMAA